MVNGTVNISLQKIANHTHCGGSTKLRLEHFMEALQNPESDLTELVMTETICS